MSEKESQTQRNTAIVGLESRQYSRAYNSHTDLGKQLIPMLYKTDVYTLHLYGNYVDYMGWPIRFNLVFFMGRNLRFVAS